MDSPKLKWKISMCSNLLIKIMNTINPRFPERLARTHFMLRLMEQMAGTLFRLGNITLAGNAPNGQYSILMPNTENGDPEDTQIQRFVTNFTKQANSLLNSWFRIENLDSEYEKRLKILDNG